MEMSAAVFRKVHEPLTIETVDIDKPRGREVLVRTVATGVCHSDLHVVDGLGRFPLDRPFVLGHEGAGVVEAVGADVTTVRVGRSRRRLPVRLLRHLSAMPERPSERLHRRHRRARRDGDAARVAERPAVPDRSPLSAATPSTCCCTRTRWCASSRNCRWIAPRWSVAAC